MPRPTRSQIIHGSLLAFALMLVLRAAQVQLWQGARWAARAERQHFGVKDVPAPRGDLFDERGVPLAQSRELIRIAVAPRDVRSRATLARGMARLGVPREWAARAADRRRRWVQLPGRYLPADAAALTALRGVHAEPVIDRVYAQGEAMRRVVGRVAADGSPLDGLELALDTVLRGRNGTARLLRDARGRRFISPTDPGVAAEPGDHVVLTINRELQDIAERALREAVARMGASGGDVVILDPHQGEVRALASHRTDGSFAGVPALAEPFEPGSTLKPFVVAGLLSRGRAQPDERIDTDNGVMTLEGRTITDIHRASSMTLAEVIQQSSNVGIVKFASRLRPREQFETLRDFGFGAPTGVSFPSEASGTLRAPRGWSRMSPASLAMGYEIAVTPLQLAAAYAAFANGGELLEPALIKEIRSATGRVRFRHERRVVRRVMREGVAREIRQMLAGAVEAGTATRAGLGSFAVAGKTGTARRANGRGYGAGEYTASFVGLFPAEAPQYVVLVKLDRPRGEFYGGQTAAPVARAVLEGAIASRDAALDRRALAARESLAALSETTRVVTEPGRDLERHLVSLPLHRPPASTGRARAVPDVRGMALREAVYALHQAGFRVQLGVARGEAAATLPGAGAVAREGSLVRLVAQ